MRYNQSIRIIGENVVLVPYRKHHVEKYHHWMQSEDLQRLTASEPLSLEKEYEMQKSWHTDEDKCTFIILDKKVYDNTNNEVDAMIGDTNLFFSNGDNRLVAEVEIMIAEEHERGKKYGWEAIILMLLFGIEHLNVKHFIAKISSDNVISINLFLKLGFFQTSQSNIFNETTFESLVDENWITGLKQNINCFTVDKNYV